MDQRERKTVFLDIGGVVLTNGWDHHSRMRAATHFNIDYPAMDALHNFIFNIYEIGQITLEQYLDTVVFTTKRNFTHQEFADFIKGESAPLPGMIPWLTEWRKTTRHRVIAINNEGKELNDYRIDKFGLRDCFDAFVSSCEVKMRKPDPGIFHLALGIAHSKPGDSIYFDDRPMLAAAAARIGIHAHVHESFEQTKSILENIN